MDRIFAEIKRAIEEEMESQNPQRRPQRGGQTAGPPVPQEWVQGQDGERYRSDEDEAEAYERRRNEEASERRATRQQGYDDRRAARQQRHDDRIQADVRRMASTRAGIRRAIFLKEIIDQPVSMRKGNDLPGW